MKCVICVPYIVIHLCVNVRSTPGLSLLGGKSVINIISGTKVQFTTTKVPQEFTTERPDNSTLLTLEEDQVRSSVDTRVENLLPIYVSTKEICQVIY